VSAGQRWRCHADLPPDFRGTYLFSFTWWELVALAPLLGALVIAAIARCVGSNRRFDLAGFFVLVLLLSLLNLKTGSASLSERLAPFSGIAIVMTIVQLPAGPLLVRTLCAAALAGLIGRPRSARWPTKAGADACESELAAGRANPEKPLPMFDMIALRDSKLFAWRVRPTLHAAPTVAWPPAAPDCRRRCRRRAISVTSAAICRGADFMRSTADWVDEPDALPWPNSATPTRARRKS